MRSQTNQVANSVQAAGLGELAFRRSQFLNQNTQMALTVLALGNFATGGSIGTAAITVDIASAATVAQTTAGQTITLPAPTVTSTQRFFTVINTGSTSVTVGATAVANGNAQVFEWNTAAWVPVA